MKVSTSFPPRKWEISIVDERMEWKVFKFYEEKHLEGKYNNRTVANKLTSQH